MSSPTTSTSPWQTTHLQLTDGRRLEVATTGDEALPAVVLHHGTPQAFMPMTWLVETARDVGVRLVTLARPGYRTSSRQPGRTVADVAADTAAALDHLGIDRCVTAGTSGGGPHALACAALLPDRVAAASSVCGVAPYDGAGAVGLDFLAGMGEDNVAEFGAALEGEGQLRAFLEGLLPALTGGDADAFLQAWDSLLPEVDKASLTGDIGHQLVTSTTAALDGPVDGWVDDDLAFVRPWGFALGAIEVPLSLWQGGEDKMVPFAHGGALRQLLPQGVRVHLMPEQGHLSIVVGSFERVLRELLEMGGVERQVG
ncbi:MAG: alpha/beta hydrolase [Actinomycetota bacterium]|nr:alpha/beta hydrolase [Actinomycetota bacterium]